jgi:hypothetical protein
MNYSLAENDSKQSAFFIYNWKRRIKIGAILNQWNGTTFIYLVSTYLISPNSSAKHKLVSTVTNPPGPSAVTAAQQCDSALPSAGFDASWRWDRPRARASRGAACRAGAWRALLCCSRDARRTMHRCRAGSSAAQSPPAVAVAATRKLLAC